MVWNRRYGDVERREKKVAAAEQYDDQHNAHLNDRGYRRRCSQTADERLCEIRFRQLEKGEVDSMQDTGRDVIPLGMISG